MTVAPTCHSTFVAYFYTGKNRPVNLTCQMNDANPQRLNFTWILPSGQIRVGNLINTTTSYITILPSLQDFGTIRCRAQNEFGGIGECDVNMVLGATPDPIESCRYTYINATLTVNCAAGFHQGDEDFFCYMYKKQGNGSYSEHARLKGNCAFILPDQKPELHHDFRVFTKNKYGDNYEKSFSITVGKPKVHIKENGNIYPVRPYRSKDLMTSNGGPTLRFAQPRSIYNENESTSTRHSTLKETDLDELLGSAVLTTPTVKSLTMRSNGRIPVSPLPPPLFAAFQQQPSPFILDEYHQQHLLPIASQRRSSFQAATKQNGIDLLHESFYLSDIKLKHHDQYDNTERDLREREHYRETRRREYSSYRDDMADTSRQNDDVFNPRHSLVVENQMLTDGNERYNVIENPTDDRNDTEFNRWNEMKESEEIDYGLNSYIDSNYTDKDHILMDDYNDRNTGGADLDMDRLTNYTDDRNDSFRNFDRNDEQTDWNDMRGEEDRYRENGIFV
ncbi:unnamed protein product [Didymodactylos carnosus]|uniref:Ig-like domain-containing protein n=1 Tax=Didymodactylos carnosus TaxID=1234261 RepID=A0A8S2CPS8_9BILA|nr:unnamed protein product [Didymodactylos carnosus]CAF3526268.1 unnamed protein product [Didymodactylos carnosus]